MNKFTGPAWFVFVLVILSLLLLISTPVVAQAIYRVHIDYIDNQHFPQVDAYVSVADAQGASVTNLGGTDFSVSEDNKLITNFKVSYGENTKQPLAVALVIDTSGSMNLIPVPTPLQESISAAKAFLNSLGSQDQAAVVEYSDSPVVASDFTQDKKALGNVLDQLQGGSGSKSAMFDAIRNAVGLLKNRSERRVIILITDGKDTHSQATIDQAISEANQAGVQIYTIGFGAVNHDQLYKLADQTGGSWIIQPSVSGLQAAFNNILQILREQYQIEYTSALLADNNSHSLAIGVTLQGALITASDNFTAQPGKVAVTLPYKDGQTVGGNVIFNPDISSPAPPARLDITMDGASLTTVSAAPFAYTWTSNAATTGIHEIILKVTDQAGNTGQTSVHLNVQPPITVKIIQPSSGDQLKNSTSIMANVTSLPEINVTKVDIAVDGKIIKTLTASPYQTNLDLTGVSAGPHTISVTASDVNAFTSEDKITVSVAISDSFGWLIIPGALAVLAIMIPLALRTRRRRAGVVGVVPSTKVKTGAAQLRELNGMNPDQVWPLGIAELHLGRKRDENDIPLQGLSASRRHAVIRFEQGEYIIQGVSANNPVIVNNETISQSHILRAGDVIQLGETTLRFEQS